MNKHDPSVIFYKIKQVHKIDNPETNSDLQSLHSNKNISNAIEIGLSP